MTIERYSFTTSERANALHSQYSGTWGENLLDKFPTQWQEAKKRYPHKKPKKLFSHLRHWVRLLDPSMQYATVLADASVGNPIDYTSQYKFFNKHLPKDQIEWIQSMTMPGRMLSTIQYAVANKDRTYPKRGIYSQCIEVHTNPFSEWYHPTFTKDLLKIAPHWCKHTISEEEGKELLEHFIKVNKRMPESRQDKWLLPKSHPLIDLQKHGYKIEPNLYYFYKRVKPKQNLIIAEMYMKKGKMPPNNLMDKLKYNNKEQLQKLWKKYPNVYKQTHEGRKKFNQSLEDIKKNPECVSKMDLKNLQAWQDAEKIMNTFKFNDVETYLLKCPTKVKNKLANTLKNIDSQYPYMKSKIIRQEITKIRKQLCDRFPEIIDTYRKANTGELTEKFVSEAKAKHTFQTMQNYIKKKVPFLEVPRRVKLSYSRHLSKKSELAKTIITNKNWLDTKWIGQQRRIMNKLWKAKRRQERKKERLNG